MAMPTYDELLAHHDMDSSIMRETFDDKCLRQFSLILDMWERLAKFLEMPNSDIMNIKSQGDVIVQKLRMLECWKQRHGSMATYEVMVKALLRISRTDLAEKVITLRKSLRPPKTILANQILPYSKELISLTAPTSPASSSGIENVSLSAAMSPLSLVASVQIYRDELHSKVHTKAISGSSEVPSRLWHKTAATAYNAAGGRDVLILAPYLSLLHPEAVARRPGKLTEKDKQKLQSQGLPPDCYSELAILLARCKLDRRLQVARIKSKTVSKKEAMEDVLHLLMTTQNKGVLIYYIGAGRRHTGDWCFEDGFITFRNIAQLYQRASHNFKGRILTIISDCSYSGCWVRDCMEFLDEQGVQPCGHKAREKGMVIKVATSCKYNEIPTEYRYSVSGMDNDKSTGMMVYWPSKQLLETQTTDDIDSSFLHCDNEMIDEPCTLQPGLTWKRLEKREMSSECYKMERYPHVSLCWKKASPFSPKSETILTKSVYEYLVDLEPKVMHEVIEHTDHELETQRQQDIDEKHRHTFNVLPSISIYYECSSNIASVPFLSQVEILTFDSFGGEYYNPDHGIVIRIPVGAILPGQIAHLEIAVALYGPFQFPSGSCPISPILWLCIQESFSLRKPIDIVLPHFLTSINEYDIESFGIRFAKADHKQYVTNTTEGNQYVFRPLETAFIAYTERNQNYGILPTQHCCFFCITSRDPQISPDFALKAGYYLWCIERPSSCSLPSRCRDTLHFCATYCLPTCRKALKSQYTEKEGYCIRKPKMFIFKDPEDGLEPYLLIKAEDEKCVMAADPKNKKIKASQIYFWDEKHDKLELLQADKVYPPSVTLTIEVMESYPINFFIKFNGSIADDDMDMEIMLPLASARHSDPEHTLSATLFDYESQWIATDKPELSTLLKELLSKVACKWENIGILLKIEPHSLESIKTAENNIPHNCLREMLKIWLKQINPPPSWSAITDALQCLGEEQLGHYLQLKYLK